MASLMTRWWLFRACNNPAPSVSPTDNGFAVDQHQQQVSPVLGNQNCCCCCSSCCCANKHVQSHNGCRNKCGSPCSSPKHTAPIPVQSTQQCESVCDVCFYPSFRPTSFNSCLVLDSFTSWVYFLIRTFCRFYTVTHYNLSFSFTSGGCTTADGSILRVSLKCMARSMVKDAKPFSHSTIHSLICFRCCQ